MSATSIPVNVDMQPRIEKIAKPEKKDADAKERNKSIYFYKGVTIKSAEKKGPLEAVEMKVVVRTKRDCCSNADHVAEEDLCSGVDPDIDLQKFWEIWLKQRFISRLQRNATRAKPLNKLPEIP